MIIKCDRWFPSSGLCDGILVAKCIRVLIVHERTEILNVARAGS